MKSSFTAEEIADAFRWFDVDAIVDLDPEDDSPLVIFITVEDIEFEVVLPGGGPFYEEVCFMSSAPSEDDPVAWATEWNEEFRWSTAVPLLPDADDPLDSIEPMVSIVRRVAFFGGVHPDHLRSAAGRFLLDVLTMFGVEFEDDSDEPENDDEFSESKIRDAILAALQLRSPQSAKQIAKTLGVPKSEINPILYGRPDLFRRKQGDPPEWSLKN